jgi:CRP-like cAMP-binding protein
LLNAEEVRLQGKVDPKLYDEILDLMGERLLAAAETVTALLSAPLGARLAKWLLELATEKPDSRTLQIDIAQEELAALVGGSREAVNRELRRLVGPRGNYSDVI